MSTEETEAEDPSETRGFAALPLALVAIFVAAVAAGGGFFLFPTSPPGGDTTALAYQEDGADRAPNTSSKAGASHGEKVSNDKRAMKLDDDLEITGGKWKTIGESAFLELDPLVISIAPIGRSKHLKVSLVIETPASEQSALSSRTFFVLDALTVYLRSVEARHLEDPSQMSLLRNELRRRISYAAPGVSIENVLITEFVLT